MASFAKGDRKNVWHAQNDWFSSLNPLFCDVNSPLQKAKNNLIFFCAGAHTITYERFWLWASLDVCKSVKFQFAFSCSWASWHGAKWTFVRLPQKKILLLLNVNFDKGSVARMFLWYQQLLAWRWFVTAYIILISNGSLSTALLDSYFNSPSTTSWKATEFIDSVTKPGTAIEIAFKYLQDNGFVDKSKVSWVKISATMTIKCIHFDL